MGHVEHASACEAPVDYAFEYITDYRNVPKWMLGLKHFAPIGEQTKGVGATFDGAINLGPITLHVAINFTDWEDDKSFGAHFTKGVDGTLTMRFEPLGEDRTRLSVVVDYTVGAGIAGKLLDKAIQAFVGPCLRYIDKHLLRQIKDGYARTAP